MLKSIEMINIQSHVYTLIDDLPPNGIITFIGKNSDGKSVFTKVLHYVLSGGIRQPEIRNGLVNWNVSCGELKLIRIDDIQLNIHIALESSDNYISYFNPHTEEKYVRTFRDRGYEDLVRLFGFHYNSDRGISLNIYNTFDALVFVNTSPAVNDALLAECLTDVKVEQSLTKYKDFKDVLEAKMSQVLQEQNELRIKLGALTVYNIEKETSFSKRFKFQQANVERVFKTQKELAPIPNYQSLPLVSMQDIQLLQQCLLALPAIVEVKKAPTNFTVSINALLHTLAALPEVVYTGRIPKVSKDLEPLTFAVSVYVNKTLIDFAESWEQARLDVLEVKDKRCPLCQRRLL